MGQPGRCCGNWVICDCFSHRQSDPACTVDRVIVELGADHRYDCSTRTLVMGILNRTPDSFWDRGRFWDFDDFLRLADRHVANGADFLDVGGSKAGPGPEVTEAEELDRVVPAVEALRARFDLPVRSEEHTSELQSQ